MAEAKKPGNILQFIVIFAAVYLLSTTALKFFFPERFDPEHVSEGITIEAVDSTVKGGHHPVLTIENNSATDIVLNDRCPMPPVLVWKITEDNVRTSLETEETVQPCKPLLEVKAGAVSTIDLAPWKYSLFGEFGTYEVELPVSAPVLEVAGTGSVIPGTAEESQYREGIIARFEIYEAGSITQIFRTFVTKPLLNLLIFIASIVPGHNLGLSIILLTLIIKIALFFPTQHAMEGQRKLQAVQPQIKALQSQYKDDPKKLQAETMRLWKENKINPLQSCLPMLLQFPILIGLYFVVKDGSHLELSRHLIYNMYASLPWTFNTHFLGLNLLLPYVWIMPPILIILQFIQMKLSFSFAKRKKAAKDGEKKEKKEGIDQQELQQKIMLYALPLMIGFFAIQFPSAVSLYWGISTIFGIGQQLVVNRKIQ